MMIVSINIILFAFSTRIDSFATREVKWLNLTFLENLIHETCSTSVAAQGFSSSSARRCPVDKQTCSGPAQLQQHTQRERERERERECQLRYSNSCEISHLLLSIRNRRWLKFNGLLCFVSAAFQMLFHWISRLYNVSDFHWRMRLDSQVTHT